jgi:hypothetical protein
MLGRCELGKPLHDALLAVIAAIIRIKPKIIKETSYAPWARPNGQQEAQTGDGAAPDPFQALVARAESLPRVFAARRAFRPQQSVPTPRHSFWLFQAETSGGKWI